MNMFMKLGDTHIFPHMSSHSHILMSLNRLHRESSKISTPWIVSNESLLKNTLLPKVNTQQTYLLAGKEESPNQRMLDSWLTDKAQQKIQNLIKLETIKPQVLHHLIGFLTVIVDFITKS